MDNNQYNQPSPGVSLGDIYFVIFRHKWKILLLAAVGVAAAATFFHLKQPPYQSEAKLLVRYISDVRAQTPVESNSQVTPVLDLAKAVLNSEVEILTSFDLAKEVATNVGPDKILAKLSGGSDPIAAAGAVSKGLKVEVAPDSSVIHLTFQHPDPGIVQPVLAEIIKDYFDMHLQVHKAGGISDELLSAETDQLRLQIQQTDDELRAAKTNAGIVDIVDSQKAYSDEIARIRNELLQTEARIAEHKAFLDRYATKQTPAASAPVPSAASSNAPPKVFAASPSTNSIPPDQYDDYRAICTRLAYLKKTEDDYLSKQGYTEDNKLVKEVRGQIAEANKIKLGFETKYPALAESEAAVPSPVSPVATDATQFAQTEEILALPDKLNILQTQLQKIQNDAAGLDEAEAKISDLQRIQNIQEKNYSSLENSLEQARIDATFGPGRVSGINSIQAPTPPFRQTSKFFKTILMLLAGGVAAGFGLAFLLEFFLDTSVKRPAEVQARLKMPFFLAIPYVRNNHGRLASAARRQLEYKSGEPESIGASPSVQNNVVQVPTPWEVDPALRAYSDALRDRLVMYFDSINLTRKPKLVAVTSASRGSGVSTVAAGLAASLSETGDGRVLLVDMNVELGAVQQFFHGKSGCKLDDAFEHEKRRSALVQENLYVVAENSVLDKLPRVLPKRFAALVPKLRASDFDYIIFDMPPVSPTSVTSRLSGFMDKVLLVVESEKTDRNIVLQANALLAQSKANTSVVLNKTRKYVPSQLEPDFNT